MSGPRGETDRRAEEWPRSFNCLHLTRWCGRYLLAAISVFAIGALVGAGLLQLVSVDALLQFAPEQSSIPNQLTVEFILWNNLIGVAVTLTGALTFGMLSIISLFVNGLIVGGLLGITVGYTSPVLLAALLLPHGIFELPALWLAGAIGLRIAHRLVRYLWGTDDEILTHLEMVEVIILIIITVLLLVIAAWIEVTLTPEIADRVGA